MGGWRERGEAPQYQQRHLPPLRDNDLGSGSAKTGWGAGGLENNQEKVSPLLHPTKCPPTNSLSVNPSSAPQCTAPHVTPLPTPHVPHPLMPTTTPMTPIICPMPPTTAQPPYPSNAPLPL